MTNLEVIILSHNRINHISPNAFINSSNLTHLDVSYNRLGLLHLDSVQLSGSKSLGIENQVSVERSNEMESTSVSFYTGPLLFFFHAADKLRTLILSGNFVEIRDQQMALRQTRSLRFLGLAELGYSEVPADFLRFGKHL